MGKLIVEIPDPLHRELKRRAMLQSRTLKQVVTELVTNYLSRAEEAVAICDDTGLCGQWEDERTAEEIIADIKSNRRWFNEGRPERD